MDGSIPADAPPLTYVLLHEFVDGGWIGELTPTQVGVWPTYLRHMNKEGIAYPGPRRIADNLRRHDVEHVRQARRKLVQAGLLIRVGLGGGRTNATYRVTVPLSTPVHSRPKSEPDSGADRAGVPGPKRRTEPGRVSTRHPGPNRTTEGRMERPTEHAHEQHADVDGEDEPLAGRGDDEAGNGHPAHLVLCDAKAIPSEVQKLVRRFPWLTRHFVLALAAGIRSANNPGAALASLIRKDGRELFDRHQKRTCATAAAEVEAREKAERHDNRKRVLEGARDDYMLNAKEYEAEILLMAREHLGLAHSSGEAELADAGA